MSEPVELDYATCERLLSSHEVGRVAVCTPAGPHVIPVNYAVLDDALLFRTAPYSVLGTYAWHSQLALEVDELDHDMRSGWSVVATGRGSMVQEDPEMAAIASLASVWSPRPWAGGTRPLLVRLRWDALTGRRVGPTRAVVQQSPRAT